MTGLALVIGLTGYVLLYSGFKAIDPRCLIQRAFNPAQVCNRIDTGEANPAAAAFGGIPGIQSTSQSGGVGGGGPMHLLPSFNDAQSAANFAKATAAAAAIQARFPTARFAGICACRHERGTGSDPSQWSVHSVCGAVDFFYSDPQSLINFAKTLPMVWDAWLDASPGDVHVQVVNQNQFPRGWIPPCAASIAGKSLP